MTNALNKRSPGISDSRDLTALYLRDDFLGSWERHLLPRPASPPLVSRGANGDPKCSGWKSSATDPLHPNSSEINVPSGVAE
jgi:hypothetical protein